VKSQTLGRTTALPFHEEKNIAVETVRKTCERQEQTKKKQPRKKKRVVILND